MTGVTMSTGFDDDEAELVHAAYLSVGDERGAEGEEAEHTVAPELATDAAATGAAAAGDAATP